MKQPYYVEAQVRRTLELDIAGSVRNQPMRYNVAGANRIQFVSEGVTDPAGSGIATPQMTVKVLVDNGKQVRVTALDTNLPALESLFTKDRKIKAEYANCFFEFIGEEMGQGNIGMAAINLVETLVWKDGHRITRICPNPSLKEQATASAGTAGEEFGATATETPSTPEKAAEAGAGAAAGQTNS